MWKAERGRIERIIVIETVARTSHFDWIRRGSDQDEMGKREAAVGEEEKVLRLSWSEKSGLLETSGCFFRPHRALWRSPKAERQGGLAAMAARRQRERWNRNRKEEEDMNEKRKGRTNTMQKWQGPKRMEMVDVIFRRLFCKVAGDTGVEESRTLILGKLKKQAGNKQGEGLIEFERKREEALSAVMR